MRGSEGLGGDGGLEEVLKGVGVGWVRRAEMGLVGGRGCVRFGEGDGGQEGVQSGLGGSWRGAGGSPGCSTGWEEGSECVGEGGGWISGKEEV